MSVVSMKKMSLVAHKGDRSRLLRLFTKSGCVEVSSAPLIADAVYPTDVEKKNVLESKKLKTSFALTFLKETLKEAARYDKNVPKAGFKKENRLVSVDEYDDTAKDEIEIFSAVDEMERLNSRLIDIKSEKAKLAATKEQLDVFKELEIPFSEIKDTDTCSIIVGTLPAGNLSLLEEKLPENADLSVYGGDKSVCVGLCVHKSELSNIGSVLAEADFIRCTYDYAVTAGEKIKECDDRITALEEEKKNTVLSVYEYLTLIPELKVLHDYYEIELAKDEAVRLCPHTEQTFIMEGWVPADRADALKEEVEKTCSRTVIFFRDPFEDENPPTLVKENKFVRPFQGLTDMFGVPGYRETDPNFLVAFFYFLIFGIMIGDAGYGLIMAIACFAYLKIVKPVKSSGMMIAMFGFCGISTFIWGALFGGWFSIEGLSQTFLGKIVIFEPLNEPLKMFMLALGVGVVQIATGFAVNGVILIKQKKYGEGIFGNFGWVLIMLGLLLLFPKMMVFLNAVEEKAWFAVCSDVGLYTAIAGFAMMLIGGAWGKKNPLKMLMGVFKSAYGSINVVSDLLSYSRIFGLGLTTGVIGLVVNKLATIIVSEFFGGLWVGWIVGVPVLIIGHAFNLGINLLGAYVHDSRLQYIEFFGRFYEGSGHAFKPLGGQAKYTYPDN